jgi:transposase
MAQERLSMRKIREVLRLKHECGLPNRVIARSVVVSHDTVREYVRRAAAAGLSWPLPGGLDDATLYERLFPKPERTGTTAIPLPDWPAVHAQLKKKGVTRRLLWEEYRAAHADGYGYSRYCDLYQAWRAQLEPVMRLNHTAGEAYVDYAGDTVPVVDPATGELREAEVFVLVLGASSYIYAEAQWSQSLPDWIGGHVRAFAAIGGVPHILVPDNLRAAVKKACRYEPDLNPTYHELAMHYGTAVVPARVRRPRDKAKVEAGVQVVQRWVLAPLRDETFVGLASLNQAIRRQLALVNGRPMRHIGQSRQALLESVERGALLPLPARPFEYAGWHGASVGIDYHVEHEGHFYSVPHSLVRTSVEVRASATTVEVFTGGVRVASHARSQARGRHTTLPEHMPPRHRAYAEWSPERFTQWAATVGPEARQLVEAVFAGRAHAEQGYRTCLGLMRLAKDYPAQRFEAACRRARLGGHTSYRGVANILKSGLDAVLVESPPDIAPTSHANVRGADYFGEAPC